MLALVTGCAGFIGSHIAERLLQERYDVIGIDNFSPYYSKRIKDINLEKLILHKKFNFIAGDLLNVDMNIFKKVEVIFHEAAQPGVRGSWGGNFSIYLRNNILATQRLLEFFKNKSIKKFIYASSSSIYGDAQLPLKEDTKPSPISPYGVTKLAAENLCYLYWKNFEVPIISLRYFTVYGERQRPDMAFYNFIKAAFKNEEIVIYGKGDQTRDFTYVEDVVEANLLAMESEVNGEVFNIGSGRQISINEVVKIIGDIVNTDLNIKYEKEKKGDVKHTLADISKAKKTFGYEPKTPLKEGIRREIEWIKSLIELKII